MIRVRDAVWGVLIGVVLVLGLLLYPAWQAEGFVERDAKLAFLEVFQGRRMLDGTIIQLPNGGGVQTDPMAQPVAFVTFSVVAEHVSWTGNEAELVVRHVIGWDRSRPDTNAAHDVHVKLVKKASRYEYEFFQVRGETPLPMPLTRNPWLLLMRAASSGTGGAYEAPHRSPNAVVAPFE